MLINERQRKILEILKKEKSVSTKNLMQRLYISESTLRRYLTQMEKQGIIHRTHGHAILIESSSLESSLQVRMQTQVKEKGQIAFKAMDYLRKDESYFVDSSSTVGYLLPFMSNYNNITVITNGLNNAAILTQKTNVRVYLPGGIVYRNTNSILGIETINYIKTFNCNAFIFSCGGISLDSGVTEASLEQSLVKREMLEHSKVHILLVDHTKFDKIFLCKTTEFKDIDYIITNKMPSQAYVQAFEKAGTRLIIA
jgi:DeoR family transcriptional regulator, carbon catabolite repression regulator